jgi:hypothetical protein
VRRAALLLLAGLASSGCFRVEVYAPHGPPVRLLSRDEKTDVKRSRRTWYSILGAVRMDNVMTAHITHFEGFDEVRIRMTDTVPDAFIGLANTVMLQVGILAQTYEVLGSRAEGREPAGSGASGTGAAPSGPSQPAGPQPE